MPGVTHNYDFNNDDGLVPGGMGTGRDGICDTVAAPGDEQVIQPGQGEANAVFITAGDNSFLDTNTEEGDSSSNTEINTGDDGIRQTGWANSQNLVPEGVPSAVGLQTYLNQVFGVQTNTFFTVSRSDVILNYDLNRNEKLEITNNPNTDEAFPVEYAAGDNSTDINLYYVTDFNQTQAVGVAFGTDKVYIIDAASDPDWVTAHEVGHCLKLQHSDLPNLPNSLRNPGYIRGGDPKLQLMYRGEQETNSTRLIKGEWDVVNPDF